MIAAADTAAHHLGDREAAESLFPACGDEATT